MGKDSLATIRMGTRSFEAYSIQRSYQQSGTEGRILMVTIQDLDGVSHVLRGDLITDVSWHRDREVPARV